jgi:serine/threonine protein kinase
MRVLNFCVWILLATTALSVDLERNVPELKRMFRSKMANLPVENLVKVAHAQTYQDDRLTCDHWIPEITNPGIYWPESPRTPDKFELSFTLGRKLGSGNVYEAMDLVTGTVVVVKIFAKSSYNTYSKRQEIENELLVLSSLPKDNPHICGFQRYLQDDEYIYQILDVCEGAKLKKLVQARSEAEARRIAKIVLKALEALHSYNIYHLDLNDGNILIHNGVARLIGFSRGVIGDEKHVYNTADNEYQTPERILNLPSTPSKIDVWYLGHIIYKWVYAGFVFGNELNDEYEKKVLAGTPTFPTPPSDELKDLLTRIFVRDNNRLTLAQVAAHPWFTK